MRIQTRFAALPRLVSESRSPSGRGTGFPLLERGGRRTTLGGEIAARRSAFRPLRRIEVSPCGKVTRCDSGPLVGRAASRAQLVSNRCKLDYRVSRHAILTPHFLSCDILFWILRIVCPHHTAHI